jgi:hypothetical protein
MTPAQREAVTQALASEGLKVHGPATTEQVDLWVLNFGDHNQQAFLFLPPDTDYFAVLSPVHSLVKLDDLPAKVLRDLLMESSRVPLAKIEFIPSDEAGRPGVFMATSRCSVDGFTGKKLHRRLEACAQLAASISQTLRTMTGGNVGQNDRK